MSLFTLLKPATGTRQRTGAYIGYRGYTVILAILKKPGTADHVSTTTGAGPCGIRRLLKQFHALRLIHCVGWVQPSHGFPAPIYLLGDGPDAPAPLTRAGQPMPHCDFKPRLQRNVVAFASLIHAMAEEIPAAKLVVESGMAASRMRELLTFMRRPEIRLVHIAAHEKMRATGGPLVRLYRWSPDTRDAVAPKPDKSKRHRLRNMHRRDIVRSPWAQMTLTLKRDAGLFQRA